MRRCVPKARYSQRRQVERVISRPKRVLGSALRARRTELQPNECRTRVLTHNIITPRSSDKDSNRANTDLNSVSNASRLFHPVMP